MQSQETWRHGTCSFGITRKKLYQYVIIKHLLFISPELMNKVKTEEMEGWVPRLIDLLHD